MRIAICGGGTVGGGVVEMLTRFSSSISIAYIVVREIGRKRDFEIPPGTIVTDRLADVLEDESVDTVVELMGGVDNAWELVRHCLRKGVNVVTANKALISKHLVEIQELLNSHTWPPAVLYEAAVCGGAPIVNAFLRGLRGDEISSVFGVMNGSTNWMLDKMDKEKVSYEVLFEEAKSLGYLEADPSADIMGWDARSKLCILARLAFGSVLNEEKVVSRGIHTVGQPDIAYANSIGKKIKLLARAWKEGNTVHAFVVPTLVDDTSAVGNLPGATNCVAFQAKYSGEHCMIGSGAGRYPTANSVVADILEIEKSAKMKCHGWFDHFGIVESACVFEPDFSAKFFLRANTHDSTLEIAARLEKVGIATELMLEFPALTTVECVSHSRLEKALDGSAVVSVLVVF